MEPSSRSVPGTRIAVKSGTVIRKIACSLRLHSSRTNIRGINSEPMKKSLHREHRRSRMKFREYPLMAYMRCA